MQLREAIQREVTAIEPLDDVEAEHRADVLAWLASGAPLCRVRKPAMPRKHLVSYFAVMDGDSILLVDHRDAGLWLPSGGHVEPEEHPRDTVRREALEELQLIARFVRSAPLMITVSDVRSAGELHTDVSLWYVLQGDRSRCVTFDASEFHSVRWFALGDVPLTRSDPHMQRFLHKYRDLLAVARSAAEPRAS